MNKREYIKDIKKLIESRGMTVFSYYYALAQYVRSKDRPVLPTKEKYNPFLTYRDVCLLYYSKEYNIESHFAWAMTTAFESLEKSLLEEDENESVESKQNISTSTPEQSDFSRDDIVDAINKKLDEMASKKLNGHDDYVVPNNKMILVQNNELQNVKNNKEDSDDGFISKEEMIDIMRKKIASVKIKMTSIGRKVADLMNGFAVVREDKTNRTHLYHHDAKAKTLKGQRTFINNTFKVGSGYYVNYQDYLDFIINDFMKKYPDAYNLQFVREDGVVKSFNQVAEEAFAILSKNGAINFGKALRGRKFDSYLEYKEANISGVEYYAGEPLKVGVYVRRDILTRIFAKYKIRGIVDVNEDNKKLVK